MRLDDLFDDTYPYATFHDSTIEKIEVDYIHKEARLFFEIKTWEQDNEGRDPRETTRQGKLNIKGLLYCVIEPPAASYPYAKAEGLWIDGEIIDENVKEQIKSFPSELPLGKFTCYFFVQEWNAFIFISAEQASFTWEIA